MSKIGCPCNSWIYVAKFMDFNLSKALSTVPSIKQVLNKKVMCEPMGSGENVFGYAKTYLV